MENGIRHIRYASNVYIKRLCRIKQTEQMANTHSVYCYIVDTAAQWTSDL